MKDICIRFKNIHQDGTDVRPRSPDPSRHWTYMFADQYKDYEGVTVVWKSEGPTLQITKDYKGF